MRPLESALPDIGLSSAVAQAMVKYISCLAPVPGTSNSAHFWLESNRWPVGNPAGGLSTRVYASNLYFSLR